MELERKITQAQRTNLDGLKQVNDSHGHAAGDELPCHIIDTIRTRVRPYDLIKRADD